MYGGCRVASLLENSMLRAVYQTDSCSLIHWVPTRPGRDHKFQVKVVSSNMSGQMPRLWESHDTNFQFLSGNNKIQILVEQIHRQKYLLFECLISVRIFTN